MLKLFVNLNVMVTRVLQDEHGQGLTEYALIMALVGIVAIAALSFLGHKVTSALSTVGNSLTT